MNHENTQKLLKRFPVLYQDYYTPMNQTCMCWGFETNGEGWFPIIWQLSLAIEDVLGYSPLQKRWFLLKKRWAKRWNDLVYKLSPAVQDKMKQVGTGVKGDPYRFVVVEKAPDCDWTMTLAKMLLPDRSRDLKSILGRFQRMGLKTFVVHPDTGFKVDQVKEKFGCYDGNTEVLTKDGWKLFSAVTYHDEMATLNLDGYLVYEAPTDIIAYPYSGKMYSIKSRGIDLVVTPNHRLYAAKAPYWNGRYSPPKKKIYPMEFCTPDLYFGEGKEMQKGALWTGVAQETFTLPGVNWSHRTQNPNKPAGILMSRSYERHDRLIPMNAWLTFLGWYIAEGCTSPSRADVSIAANNTDGGIERSIVEKAIKEIGYDIVVSMERRSAVVYKIYDTQICRWLRDNCGMGAGNKTVPQFVKELPPDQIKMFLDSLFAGDGHKAKTSHKLFTASRKLADDVIELILKAGDVADLDIRPVKSSFYKGVLIKGNHPRHEVNWMTKSFRHTIPSSAQEQWIEFSGQVYCATVSTGLLYVRRNGKSVWCGNSLRFYCGYNDLISKYVNFAESLSAITCEQCGAYGKTECVGGWYSTRCKKHSDKEAVAEDETPEGKAL